MEENIQVKKAIEEITYFTKKFPEAQFRILSENPKEAAPYLIDGIRKAVKDNEKLDEDYELYLYGLYLLAQFGCKEAFPDILQLISLDADTLDMLLGDLITEDLNNILYSTYDGNLEAVKNYILNEKCNGYARGAALDLYVQLYYDKEIERQELEDFFRKIIYDAESEDYEMDTHIVGNICDCHLITMLPDIKYLFEQERVDDFFYGTYDVCVDLMFRYDMYTKVGCRKVEDAAAELRRWSMFEQPKQKRDTGAIKAFEKEMQMLSSGNDKQDKKVKIYPNDPCPCGSGKKYKKCCMNKKIPTEELCENKMKADQEKWLKDYPPKAEPRLEGRIYLEDYFEQDSIEIDKLVYLAIKNGPEFSRKPGASEEMTKRQIYYYRKAFEQYRKKCEKEEIKTFREYDEKHAIHYDSKDWIWRMENLLKKQRFMSEAKEVREFAAGRK